jgi:hypothetical protein
MSCSIFLIFFLISGPDLFVKYILLLKPKKFQVCSYFIFDSRKLYCFLTAFLDIAVAVCYFNVESLYLNKSRCSVFQLSGFRNATSQVVFSPALA